jgi:alpha-galactosidase
VRIPGVVAALLLAPVPARAQATIEPANGPAIVQLTDGHLRLTYGGAVLLDAKIETSGPPADFRRFVDSGGGVVTQVLKWTALAGGRITLKGTVRGSPESFAAEAEPRRDGLPLVRHTIGQAANLRNRAVYDRRFDWVLSVDFPAGAEIAPAPAADSAVAFDISATGEEVALRFRPRFYQRHRGLSQYRPWTYQPWAGSVAGWTSWYAFFDKVTEADIKRTADVVGEELRPFGYRYLQIDDGYQRTPIGVPSHWLETNEKFPGGLAALRRYIGERGLDAGIWTNASFQDRVAAEANPRWFVRTPDGRPALGNWVGYVMDASEPSTIADLVAPVYRDLKATGWTYFKLDALRHLRYEGYNSFAEYFTARGLDREEVFRDFVRTVRGIIGSDTYLLACWGIRPELIGLVDGVRVGDDGFGYGSFAQYNSFNNVVWKNDPDHIELSKPDAFRAATLTSLTGSALMLTDPPEVYRTPRVEAARRTAPVLFTRPGQLHDVDPSRSALLSQAAASLSGAGPRPFDADQRLVVPLYQLDIARPFEQWTVLARTGGSESPIALSDLGLAAKREYVAFEFWTHRFLGVVNDSLRPGPVDPRFQVQVFCLRVRVSHPQVVATNRHVTCGGPDLADVRWGDGVLAGVSELVAGDVYAIYVAEPAGYRLQAVDVEGATLIDRPTEGGARVIRLRSEHGGRATWRVRYAVP